MSENPPNNPPYVLQPKVHWSRATGYLQLGMLEQAKTELGMLPHELPWGKQKRAMRVEISKQEKNWAEMCRLAHGLRMEIISDVFDDPVCDVARHSLKEVARASAAARVSMIV